MHSVEKTFLSAESIICWSTEEIEENIQNKKAKSNKFRDKFR